VAAWFTRNSRRGPLKPEQPWECDSPRGHQSVLPTWFTGNLGDWLRSERMSLGGASPPVGTPSSSHRPTEGRERAKLEIQVRVLVRRPLSLLPKRRQRRIALVMRGVRRTSGWELHFFSAWLEQKGLRLLSGSMKVQVLPRRPCARRQSEVILGPNEARVPVQIRAGAPFFSAWWNLYHTRLRTSGSGRESRRGVHFPLEGKAAEVRCPVGNRRERLQRFRGRTGAFRHFRFGG
jgi:hypothetical protein